MLLVRQTIATSPPNSLLCEVPTSEPLIVVLLTEHEGLLEVVRGLLKGPVGQLETAVLALAALTMVHPTVAIVLLIHAEDALPAATARNRAHVRHAGEEERGEDSGDGILASFDLRG